MSQRPPAVNVEDHTRTVDIESGAFPVLDCGAGPAVVLLHGFPDSRRLWRYQVPALADAGFRVVAPDLRGFGDAPAPEGVEAYDAANAVADVEAILETLGIEAYRAVGHDWGAAIARSLAKRHPDSVAQLALLSVGIPTGGPPGVEARENLWYVYFFQFEGVAEQWLRRDDWALFRAFMREDGDTERYVEELSRPGRLTAALNWYRANAAPEPPGEDPGPPDTTVARCPTLGVWSSGDNYLDEAFVAASGRRVDGPFRYERIEGASHWIPLDAPDEANRILLEFIEE